MAKKTSLKVVKDDEDVKHPYVPRSFPPSDKMKKGTNVPILQEDFKGHYVRYDAHGNLDLSAYDHIIVMFSGGKDSIACVLALLEAGIQPERIELWHQSVDGGPGDERLWDWPCTEAYCIAFAKAFGLKIRFQWKIGGFVGELHRGKPRRPGDYDERTPTSGAMLQLGDGSTVRAKGKEQIRLPKDIEENPTHNQRMRFPQMVADLGTRWCSAYLKIDVAAKMLSNDPRFKGAYRPVKILTITGERREESGNRAGYATFDEYGVTKERIVHTWRPVLAWFERDVWEIIERYNVRLHPAYYLGFGRVSCMPCIFGKPDQWATIKDIAPHVLDRLVGLEQEFTDFWRTYPGTVKVKKKVKDENGNEVEIRIDKPIAQETSWLRRDGTLLDAAERGTSFVTPGVRWHLPDAFNEHYDKQIIMGLGEWTLPVGAYKKEGGPI